MVRIARRISWLVIGFPWMRRRKHYARHGRLSKASPELTSSPGKVLAVPQDVRPKPKAFQVLRWSALFRRTDDWRMHESFTGGPGQCPIPSDQHGSRGRVLH